LYRAGLMKPSFGFPALILLSLINAKIEAASGQEADVPLACPYVPLYTPMNRLP
jgi:hypothetical protein